MPGPKEHLGEVDVLRFCAACAVLLHHFTFWIWANPDGIAARASGGVVSYPELAWLGIYGWVGVQVFFVISGFVIAYSATSTNSSWLRFLRSRVVRLAPAAWVCATITLVISIPLELHATPELLVAWARSVLFIPKPRWIDSVYWTLGIEIAFYALVLGLLVLKRARWIKPLAGAVGLVSGAFWATYWLVKTWGSPTYQALFLELAEDRVLELMLVQHGCFFALGVYLWSMRTDATRLLDRIALVALTCIGGLQIAAKSLTFEPWIGHRASPVVAVSVWLVPVIALAVSARSRPQGPRRPWLRQLGLATYPLYLLHNVVGSALIGALASAGVHRYLALATGAALMVLLSFGISMYVEPWLQRAVRARFDRLACRLHRARDVRPAYR